MDQLWIPIYDYMNGWEAQGQFFLKSTKEKYVYSVYYSCLFLFGNDVGARNDIQLTFVAIMNIIGGFIMA